MDDSQNWRARQMTTLRMNYAKAPFVNEMLDIAQEIYSMRTQYLCELNIAAIEKIAAYFGISPVFLRSSKHQTDLTSSSHLLELLKQANGDIYITGHGARNYLNHQLFEEHHIQVEYMNYQHTPYPQLHGDFTPYVSVLDLIANVGPKGARAICSPTQPWREFLK